MTPPGDTLKQEHDCVIALREAEAAEDAKAARRIEDAAERGAARQVAAGEDALLAADQVAAILNVTEDRVWALTREGKLPHVKLGRRTNRYRRAAVVEAMRELEK
jgi:excisionase family DNA binding protein